MKYRVVKAKGAKASALMALLNIDVQTARHLKAVDVIDENDLPFEALIQAQETGLIEAIEGKE